MTASRMFAPPPSRQPVAVWIGLVAAVLAATLLLSNFVDKLHLSIARGEALRAAQQQVIPTHFGDDKPMLMAQAPSQKVNR